MIAALAPTTEYDYRARFDLKSLLFVTDDADDFAVAQHEVGKLKLANPVRRVSDAAELSQYISGDGPYVDRCKHPLPLLIVLDVLLPGSGCLKAQSIIRSNFTTHGLPIILAGSKEDIESVRSASSVATNGCVAKPFSRLDFGRILLENKIPLTVVDSVSA